MTDRETWREIAGYPGYEVSTWGRVRSWRTAQGTRLQSPRLKARTVAKRTGYPRVTLSSCGVSRRRNVHTLVLETFVGPRPPGMVARHYPDNTKTNVALSNLRWGTHEENAADSVADGTAPRGELNGAAKLSEKQVQEIIALTGLVPTPVLAAWHGVTKTLVGMIQRNECWTYLPRPSLKRSSALTSGSLNSRARLTEAEVIAIRASEERPIDLAARFGVKPATVSNIRAGRIWKHVCAPGART